MEALLKKIKDGDSKTLARAISIIENHVTGYEEILTALSISSTPVIGITGPPGAGKSTLTDGLIKEIVSRNKKVGVLCVDPSSPFNFGALLGDRIRMSSWYNHPSVFIRSLAGRGSLGGLHPSIIEITDLMRYAPFDYIIVETVGVGQSEVEIAGLADITVVVLVPESGDEIQTMKAGLMEIADIFVVNKADRPDADLFEKNLRGLFSSTNSHTEVPVIKTIASQHIGMDVLFNQITLQQQLNKNIDRRAWLLTDKAYNLIMAYKMEGIHKTDIYNSIKTGMAEVKEFNVYKFVAAVRNKP